MEWLRSLLIRFWHFSMNHSEFALCGGSCIISVIRPLTTADGVRVWNSPFLWILGQRNWPKIHNEKNTPPQSVIFGFGEGLGVGILA